MTDTPLDALHARMQAAPDDDQARMAYFAQLAGTELFLMLTAEVTGDQIDPALFQVGEMQVALAFDTEDRLATFAGATVPYAGLSGRVLAQTMAGQGVGLGVNLDTPAAFLMPPEALDWLAATLEQGPAEGEARPEELFPPAGLPEAFVAALDARLAAAAGLARAAYLVGVAYDDGTRGHLLGITGAVPGAEGALAQVVNEALIFSGIEAGALDVTFVADSDPLAAGLARVGLRFDLPKPETPTERPAPGSDPDAPPILR